MTCVSFKFFQGPGCEKHSIIVLSSGKIPSRPLIPNFMLLSANESDFISSQVSL